MVSIAPSNEWSTYYYCSNSPLQRMQYKEVFVSLVPCNNGVHTTIAPIAPCNEWSTKKFCSHSPLQCMEYKEVLFLMPLATNGVQRSFVFNAPCNKWSTYSHSQQMGYKKFGFYGPFKRMEYIQLHALSYTRNSV